METQQAVTNEQLFAKLCDVEKLLAEPKVEKGLWDIQDVADFCGMSYGHVYSNIVSDPRFPAPVDIGSRTGKPKKLFLGKEVKAYFEKNKQKKHRI